MKALCIAYSKTITFHLQEAMLVAARRFLVIRLSSIGDVLHCTPVARALRQALPSAHITWVVGEVPAKLLTVNPFLDEVYVWPREKWEGHMRQGQFGEAWKLWRKLRDDLQARSFDVALDVHGLFLSGLVAYASGAPLRIGLAGTRELNHWFMTELAPPAGDVHVIRRYLTILRPLGIMASDPTMTLAVSPATESFAEQFLNERGVTAERQIITLIPATSWPSKSWPPEYFATIANYLGRRSVVMLCGGPGDRSIADAVLKKTKGAVIDAVGQTDLVQLAALLKRSTAVVTGDTGPLHMAVAMGVPTVSIFGPSKPHRFAPLAGPHIVLTAGAGCAACFKQHCRYGQPQCMKAIVPRRVLQALSELLPAANKKRNLPGRKPAIYDSML